MTGGQAKEDVAEKVEPIKPVLSEKVVEPAKKEVAVVKKVKKSAATKSKKPKSPKNKKDSKGNPPVAKKPDKKEEKEEIKPVSGFPLGLPVFEVPVPAPSSAIPIIEQKKLDMAQTVPGQEGSSGKKTIRRSGLEIKKAEEFQEKKRLAQEKEWEIPAFLRKVKFKS